MRQCGCQEFCDNKYITKCKILNKRSWLIRNVLNMSNVLITFDKKKVSMGFSTHNSIASTVIKQALFLAPKHFF